MLEKWIGKIYIWLRKQKILKKLFQKDIEKMKRLYPGESWEKKVEMYYRETIGMVLKIMLAGIALVSGALLLNFTKGEETILSLDRKAYGEGNTHVKIVGQNRMGYTWEDTVEVTEWEYNLTELSRLYEEVLVELEDIIKGENASLDEVDSNLILPDEIPGYPFAITWKSSNRSILGNNGKLADDDREKAMEVTLTAVFEYQEFEKEKEWELWILPTLQTEEEKWRFYVEKALEESNQKSLQEQKWILPEEIGGIEMEWRLQKDSYLVEMAGLFGVCLVLVVWGRNHDLKRRLKERELSLETEYCNVVTKLVLYLGAGMTVKCAWKKAADDQFRWNPKSVAAQEMLLAYREMEGGVYEKNCYELFGRRCGRQEYIRLGSLLSQNLRKGNSELLGRLQEEVRLAQDNRRHLVKRRGEEASTKLLAPMVLLLGMTMVLIMIPAFSGIG